MNMLPQRQSHIIKQKTGPDDPELQTSLQEALGQVAPEDVIAIADELAERHARLFLGLQSDSASLASSFADVASAVTHTKANARTITNYFSQSDFAIFDQLLKGGAPTPVRVAAFVEKLNALDTRLALELATGLLHNISPSEHWLWTRWLWDPTTGTGILPLLAGSTHNLLADNLADGYARVGMVTAMSVKFGEGTGLWTDELIGDEKRAPFANSAFLACAYNVYLYGTTSWRLSREFNNLLPSLPNMARRLLGLKKSGS
ncbi:MAG: hypothetical protein QY306_12230 [Anaerolineales bacterium]|nr:MAG: hypothetical protein QY306_12230 [Anaerolineales bacterium]